MWPLRSSRQRKNGCNTCNEVTTEMVVFVGFKNPFYRSCDCSAVVFLPRSSKTKKGGVVKPHGHLVRLGYTCCHASTCRLSTWWSPTALQGSCDPGGFILGRASHLDAFSGSPVPAWLPGAAFGNTTGTPEASPSRSSRTKDGFPQSSNAHDGYRPNCLTTF